MPAAVAALSLILLTVIYISFSTAIFSLEQEVYQNFRKRERKKEPSICQQSSSFPADVALVAFADLNTVERKRRNSRAV